MHVTIPFSCALPAIPKGAQNVVEIRAPVTIEITKVSDGDAPVATRWTGESQEPTMGGL